MNLRSPDDTPEGVRKLRRPTLGESTWALVFTFITALSGFAYSALYVKFQTDQNAQEIRDLKTNEAQLWAGRNADKDALNNRLAGIESKLDQLIGQIDGRKR